MLHHLSLAVADLPRAAAFYDAVLATLGYDRVWEYPEAIGYGSSGGDDKLAPYSSSGPTWYDGLVKPDVVAPGHMLASESAPRSVSVLTVFSPISSGLISKVRTLPFSSAAT